MQDKQIREQIPAIQPKFIIDSIGVGDAFDAGFLQGLLKGRTLKQSVKMGVKAASMSLEGIDSTEKFPTRIFLDF